jgi:hypothetical protein
MTSIEALQKGKYVPEIGRFSMPPVDTDVAGLTLELDDLEDLARCEPGDCGLKLSAPEIARLAGQQDVDVLHQQMRRIIVQRASDFLQRGDEALPPYVDHREPVDPAFAFAAVLQRVEFLPKVLPCLDAYLRAFPAARESHLRQSLLYWSKESLGLKPIISITHVSAARFEQPHLPEAVVVARQVYASHYKNASITVTALVPDGSVRYVVYLNRTHVDAFGGVFGKMVRRLVERRVNAEAPDVLLNLRRRMEAGEPPA